jgi:hypothetical protein
VSIAARSAAVSDCDSSVSPDASVAAPRRAHTLLALALAAPPCEHITGARGARRAVRTPRTATSGGSPESPCAVTALAKQLAVLGTTKSGKTRAATKRARYELSISLIKGTCCRNVLLPGTKQANEEMTN